MGELSSIRSVLTAGRHFAAGAIAGATALELLHDLRRRAYADDEPISLTADGWIAAGFVDPGSYRAICARCRRPLVAILEGSRISWVAQLEMTSICGPIETMRPHVPTSGAALARAQALRGSDSIPAGRELVDMPPAADPRADELDELMRRPLRSSADELK